MMEGRKTDALVVHGERKYIDKMCSMEHMSYFTSLW